MVRTSVWPVIATVFVCLQCQSASVKAASRPNVVFFLSDDQRADFMECAGHPILKTPTMDRLAANGVRFENMFVTTSICAASRATIFTGHYERSHRFTFGTPPIRKELTAASYPALLKKSGYRTGFVGKFGVQVHKSEQQTMFDFFRPLNRNPYFKTMPDGSTRHVSEVAGDEAVKFLRGCKTDQPFCLSVSFNAVHAEDRDKINHYPWPKSVEGMYENVKIPPPRLSDPKVFDSQPEFLKKSMNRDRWYWRWDTSEKYERNVRAYYRMITGMDNVMGRVLRQLKKLGFDKNTVVIFSGDNGYYKGARGFAGKWSHYEESLRVPLIIFDPRAKKSLRGKVDSHMVVNVDIPATILGYAGTEIPNSYQGASLVPLMNDRAPDTWRSDFFCEHLMDHKSIPKYEGVRGERYVYARYFEQQPAFEFLHDLKIDPDQLKNLANDPSHAAAMKKMRNRCDQLRDSYGGKYRPHKKKR